MSKTIIAFAVGVTVGSLVTLKIVEKKYKQIADEEIDSVIKQFKKRDEIIENEIKQIGNGNIFDNTQEEYESEVNMLGYSVPTEYEEYKPKNPKDEDYTICVGPGEEYIEPYVIAPEDYGEVGAYDAKSWKFYADLVLTDEEGEIVVDPESVIGNALGRFGEYEPDSVYVRNENTWCDYEILKQEETFSEINGSKMNVDSI